MRLTGKVAIITGSARGIGKAYALRFAQEGASVVVADMVDGAATRDEILKNGGKSIVVSADVTSEEDTRKMAQAALDHFGRIDILLNNAGGLGNLGKKEFTEISGEEWDTVLAKNLKGMFNCCKAVCPQMKQQGKGKIINISSTTALLGIPYFLHYVTCKGAVIAFTRSLARELGDAGIAVNAISPGLTSTEAVRNRKNNPESYQQTIAQTRCFKRLELPEDLTGAAVFLASDDSDFITGQTMNVDGGQFMH